MAWDLLGNIHSNTRILLPKQPFHTLLKTLDGFLQGVVEGSARVLEALLSGFEGPMDYTVYSYRS